MAPWPEEATRRLVQIVTRMVPLFRAAANSPEKEARAWAQVAERLEHSGVDGCLGRTAEDCRKKMGKVDRSYSRSGGGGPYAAEIMALAQALAAAPLFGLQPPIAAYDDSSDDDDEDQVIGQVVIGGAVEGGHHQIVAEEVIGGEAGLVVGDQLDGEDADDMDVAQILLLLKSGRQ